MRILWQVCILVFLGTALGFAQLSETGKAELLRVWSKPDASIEDRAASVNRTFTNGTPIRAIVAVLGTNYGRTAPITALWLGPEPSRKTCSLTYSFGRNVVFIDTSADIASDPLTGQFTGATYQLPVWREDDSTNRIWMGDKTGPAWRVDESTNRIWIGNKSGSAKK